MLNNLSTLPYSALERDIDLLLLELFHVSPETVRWLAGRLDVCNAVAVSARHSVYRGNGETDVLLIVQSGKKRVALMIEDKIGAIMQPDQAQRYHIRGQELVERGEADDYRTILCAPEGYLATVAADEPWHHKVSFGEIADHLSSESGPTSEWRQAILRLCSAKARRAKLVDSKNSGETEQWLLKLKDDYREFAKVNFPQFRISRQTGRDREIFIGAHGAPAGVRFKHALFHGEVSAIFEAKHVEAAQQQISHGLPDGFWMSRFGGELHVRTGAETLDPAIALGSQIDATRDGLEKLTAALEWVRQQGFSQNSKVR